MCCHGARPLEVNLFFNKTSCLHMKCSCPFFLLMSEGLVTPRKTTARYLPGSPRVRYFQAMAPKKEKEAKEVKGADDTKDTKEDSEAAEATQPDEEETEEPPPTVVKAPKKPPAGGLKRPASAAFAKAKAKAKSKAKAKPKSGRPTPSKSPKKSPKKKKEKKNKGNADKEEKDKGKDKEKGMKKPAAAAAKKGSKSSSMKDQLDKLGQGIAEEQQQMEEGEEEEKKEEDEEVEADEKRDRLKSGKFGRLLKSGRVPDNIKKVWEACESRKKKTQLLNRLFVKNERSGQWEMKTQNPEFLSFLRSTDQTYGQAASRSFPKSIMLHSYYNSNEQAMQQALQDGDIYEVVGQGGKKMYSFDTMEEGHRKSTDNTMELHRGKVKLAKEEHAHLEETMEAFDWKQFGSPAAALKNASSASGSRTLAIADQPKVVKWESIESHLVEAKAAQDRLMKDINKCLPGVQKGKAKDESLVVKFREIHRTTQSNSQKIADALMWKA